MPQKHCSSTFASPLSKSPRPSTIVTKEPSPSSWPSTLPHQPVNRGHPTEACSLVGSKKKLSNCNHHNSQPSKCALRAHRLKLQVRRCVGPHQPKAVAMVGGADRLLETCKDYSPEKVRQSGTSPRREAGGSVHTRMNVARAPEQTVEKAGKKVFVLHIAARPDARRSVISKLGPLHAATNAE